ncbi:UNVERIFIED_CONTAM: hypothetical protein LK11_58980 [Mumia flava]|nr:isocitrate lyase/phosphoenolpyruvate mutase family protein [Mumia flava]
MSAPSPAERFLALHRRRPGFILPNAWDAGSARMLELAGFEAIATTSAGIAFAAGHPDASLSRDAMLRAVEPVVASVGVPVSVDVESGYGDTEGDVVTTVRGVLDLGGVGINLEDAVADGLLPLEESVERVAAARAVAPSAQLVLNARTDAYLSGDDPGMALDVAIERGRAYAAAGADCVFVPGVDDLDAIRALAEEIPAPLNVVNGLTPTVHTAAALYDVGAARISIGGALARAALTVVREAGLEMLERGTFSFVEGAIPYGTLQQELGPPDR